MQNTMTKRFGAGRLAKLVASCAAVWLATIVGLQAQPYLFLKTTNGTELRWAVNTVDSEPSPGSFTADTMANFDSIVGGRIAAWSGGIKIRLDTGTYQTEGIGNTASSYYSTLGGNYPILHVKGKGVGSTTLKLKDNAPYTGATVDWNYVISTAGFVSDFYVGLLKIDCNWSNQATPVASGLGASKIASNYGGSYRNGGVSTACVYGRVESCLIENFGSNSRCTQANFCNPSIRCRDVSSEGTEAFPLVLSTGNFGQTSPAIAILTNEVRNFTPVNNGYCTGIMVGTHYMGSGSSTNYDTNGPSPHNETATPPAGKNWVLGYRQTTLALIQGNNVNNLTNGIGLGMARSEQVVFDGNTVSNCKAGFNCDTLPAWNITLTNNYFYNPYVGINAGNYYASPASYFSCSNWVVTANHIMLVGRFYNSYLCQDYMTHDSVPSCLYPIEYYEVSYGVRLPGGTRDMNINNNDFHDSYPGGTFSAPSPSEKYFYGVWMPCGSNNSPTLSGNTFNVDGNTTSATLNASIFPN